MKTPAVHGSLPSRRADGSNTVDLDEHALAHELRDDRGPGGQWRAVCEELPVHAVEDGEVPTVTEIAGALDDQVLAAASRDEDRDEVEQSLPQLRIEVGRYLVRSRVQ
nr:hypothetical protein [Streptomyces sparsogenes]